MEPSNAFTPPPSPAHIAPVTRTLFRRLYDWSIHWCQTPYAIPALCLISFADSSFFPIPPDPLLIAIAFANPSKWFRNAMICMIASVTGGIFGWYIGHALWTLVGPWFFAHVPAFTPEIFEHVRARYNENAFLALILASTTPIPYKVFTIASGVFHVKLSTVILASILGRGGRYLALTVAIRLCGDRIHGFLEKNFEIASVVILILGVLGFVAIRYMH